jgi:signal transduction histidine kinase
MAGARFGPAEQASLVQRCLAGMAASETVETALELVIAQVCTFTGWIGGDVWLPSPDSDAVVYSGIHYGDDPRLQMILSMGHTIRFGEGLPGVAWRDRAPTLCRHGEEPGCALNRDPRFAEVCATTQAIAFPAFNGEHLVAILVFHLSVSAEDYHRLVEPIQTVASQLATMIKHKVAEEELRRSEALNRGMLVAMPDLIFRLSPECVFLEYQPPTGNSWFDGDAERFIGRHVEEVLPACIAEGLVDAVREARRTGVVRIWEYQQNFDGGVRERECRAVPIEELDEVMVIVRDITDRTRAEARLEAEIRSKDQLIASVSHEIRTPLTAVLGFADLFSEQSLGPADMKEIMSLIFRQAQDMSYIVEDLLVAARAKSDSLRVLLEEVSISAEIRRVIEAMPGHGEGLFVTDFDESLAIGDAARVRQILRNLLTNALRYGGSHRGIDTHSADGLVTVIVRDSGPSIPSEETEAIFEPYQRGTVGSAQPGSVGLGLTVCRTLARKMGGDVAYSHEGGWSMFTLTLPAHPAEAKTPDARESVAQVS